MAFGVVPLAPGDMQEAAMLRRTALWHRLPGLGMVHTPEEDVEYWRYKLFPRCTMLGCRADEWLVAVIAYGAGWIEQLYVLPEFQGRGIGSRLLDRAKEDMAEITLWTFQRNSGARAFYERHGFVAMRQTDGTDNEEREPDVLYRWRGRSEER